MFGKNQASFLQKHLSFNAWQWRCDNFFHSHRTWAPWSHWVNHVWTPSYARVLWKQMWHHLSDSYSLVTTGSCNMTSKYISDWLKNQRIKILVCLKPWNLITVQISTQMKSCCWTLREWPKTSMNWRNVLKKMATNCSKTMLETDKSPTWNKKL